MLCQGVNDWTKKIMTQGTFAYWTHKSFFIAVDLEHRRTQKLFEVVKTDRSIQRLLLD